jgi:uncharacterized protein
MRHWALAAAALTAAAMASPAVAQEQLRVLVGSEGGTMYFVGAALTEIVNNKQSAVRTNMTVGGGASNPARLGAGDGDFGFTFSNFALSAYNGKAPFNSEFKDLRHVASFWDACYHQYVGQDVYDSGIRSWDDIVASEKPLAMGVGSPSSSTNEINEVIVGAYGTSFDELTANGFKIAFTGAGASAQQLSASQLDLWFHNTGDPNASGVEAALGRKLTLLDLSDKAKEALTDAGFSPCTIPGGIYENIDKDHASMGALGVLLARSDTDPEVVYSILKIVDENVETLANAQKLFASWTPQYGGADYGLPLHPGAERFYREAGVIE